MINHQDLKTTLKKIEYAKGLPNKNYTDVTHFEIETKQLIFNQWA